MVDQERKEFMGDYALWLAYLDTGGMTSSLRVDSQKRGGSLHTLFYPCSRSGRGALNWRSFLFLFFFSLFFSLLQATKIPVEKDKKTDLITVFGMREWKRESRREWEKSDAAVTIITHNLEIQSPLTPLTITPSAFSFSVLAQGPAVVSHFAIHLESRNLRGSHFFTTWRNQSQQAI